jgi:predicted amidohydrolase
MSSKLKIAAVQAEPVWNDLQGGVDKVISYIKEAGANGANVVGFPEVFIPGYPWLVVPVRLSPNSIDLTYKEHLAKLRLR